MNKHPIPSRNKKVTHADYCVCPYCHKKIKYDELEEHNKLTFMNEIIVYCPYCSIEFIPNVTSSIEYKYS